MIKKGMWCVDQEGRIGIAHVVDAISTEFHRVDESGSTVLVINVETSTLVQARQREIPEVRRTLSAEKFAELGYS